MHKVNGSFSLDRIADESRERLVEAVKESGCSADVSPDGRTLTISGASEDYDVARALWRQAKAHARREELQTTEVASAQHYERQSERALERQNERKQQGEGTLMANPPQMSPGTQRNIRPHEMSSDRAESQFADLQAGQLPGNTAPPEGTQEYLQSQAEQNPAGDGGEQLAQQ